MISTRKVNMSSVTAITAIASKIGASQYAATKKAIISMTETAAIEYIPGKSLINIYSLKEKFLI